jgi:hypothetical protein
VGVTGLSSYRVRSYVADAPTPDAGAPKPQPPSRDDLIQQLVRYIPVEIIGLYLLILAAVGAPTLPAKGELCRANFGDAWTWYWLFVFLTAIVVVATQALLLRKANAGVAADKKAKFKPGKTAGDAILATVAFAAWGAALPNAPWFDNCAFTAAWSMVILAAATAIIAFIVRVRIDSD